MSKSAASASGVIDLLDDPEVTAKRIRSAVTDTEREIRFDPGAKPGISNLLTIHSALSGRSVAELEQDYEGKGYGDLKKDLAEVVVGALGPVRERALELLDDPAELDRLLADGADRAAPARGRHPRAGLRPGRLPAEASWLTRASAARCPRTPTATRWRSPSSAPTPRPGARTTRTSRSAWPSPSPSRSAASWSAGAPSSATRRPPSSRPTSRCCRPRRVHREVLPAIREHLHRAAATHGPFPMVLRGTGSFRPVSDVVFVQVAEGIAECEQIEREVRSGPLHRDLAFYYHPHVTVAHDLPHANLDRASTTLADYEAAFTVTSFTAYLHDGDGVWRVDHEFDLGTV